MQPQSSPSQFPPNICSALPSHFPWKPPSQLSNPWPNEAKP